MQAFPSAKAGLDSAVPFTACAGATPWGPGSHAVQLNHEQDARQDGAAQRSCWGPLPGPAAARPTAGATPQVQSLRLMPGMSASPARALALLNSSSLAHRGKYGALPSMSNLLPHGPFGSVPSNVQGGAAGGGGSGGACSPFKPAATSSQMVPSPEPPASFSAPPAAAIELPQAPQLQHTVHVQQLDGWAASRLLNAMQQGAALLPPQLPPQLRPFCLPLPAVPGGRGGDGAGPSQLAGQAPEMQQAYNLSSFEMDFEFSLEVDGSGLSSESSPATTLGLHALMDEVQEHGDALTSTLMVTSDIFRPMPLQGAGDAERERLAQQAVRALREDSISPSPECSPLLLLGLGLPPAVRGAALKQQQQQQAAQQQAAQQQAPAPPPQPATWQQLVAPQLPPLGVQPMAAPAAKPPPMDPIHTSVFASAVPSVHGVSSESGSDGSSNCGQVSSSGSECSGCGTAGGVCSDSGVAALLALCSIANQADSQAVPLKREPSMLPGTLVCEQLKQPGEQPAEPPRRPQRPPSQRARHQARRPAQQAQQQQAGRQPAKPSGGSKSPAAAAKLGVKRGSVCKARPRPASSPPASKRARVAAAAARALPAAARKAADKPAAKPAAGAAAGAKAPKPEPKRALSIDLLEAQGCFDMQQDKAAAHMGFGKTWFKEAIKKIGIERWPYRQLSTLKQSVLVPLEEAITQHGRQCSPRRASELLAAVRAEYAAVRDKAIRASAAEDSQAGQEGKKDDLLSDAMRGLRQDIAYKPRNEAKRAADEGSSIPEERLEREVQRVVHKWHARLCQP